MISEKKTIHQRVKQNNCHCGFSQDNSFFFDRRLIEKKKIILGKENFHYCSI